MQDSLLSSLQYQYPEAIQKLNKLVLEYEPTPYTFKSGKSAGKYAVVLMFSNPAPLWFQYQKAISELKKDSYVDERLIHLHWIRTIIGPNLKPRALCQHCKQNPVSYYTTRYSYENELSVYPFFTYCDKCINEHFVYLDERTQIIEFSLIDLWTKINYNTKRRDKRLYLNLYRWAYGYERFTITAIWKHLYGSDLVSHEHIAAYRQK